MKTGVSSGSQCRTPSRDGSYTLDGKQPRRFRPRLQMADLETFKVRGSDSTEVNGEVIKVVEMKLSEANTRTKKTHRLNLDFPKL